MCGQSLLVAAPEPTPQAGLPLLCLPASACPVAQAQAGLHDLVPLALAQPTVCTSSLQRSTPSPVPQTRESSALEKQLVANAHGAGSKSLALAAAGRIAAPRPARAGWC